MTKTELKDIIKECMNDDQMEINEYFLESELDILDEELMYKYQFIMNEANNYDNLFIDEDTNIVLIDESISDVVKNILKKIGDLIYRFFNFVAKCVEFVSISVKRFIKGKNNNAAIYVFKQNYNRFAPDAKEKQREALIEYNKMMEKLAEAIVKDVKSRYYGVKEAAYDMNKISNKEWKEIKFVKLDAKINSTALLSDLEKFATGFEKICTRKDDDDEISMDDLELLCDDLQNIDNYITYTSDVYTKNSSSISPHDFEKQYDELNVKLKEIDDCLSKIEHYKNRFNKAISTLNNNQSISSKNAYSIRSSIVRIIGQLTKIIQEYRMLAQIIKSAHSTINSGLMILNKAMV